MKTHTHLKQKGAALVVGLIFLLILTMIGVSAIQTSSLEERMAGNLRESQIAMLAAEAALRSGEITVENRLESGPSSYDNTTIPATPAPDPLLSSSWTGTVSAIVNSFTDLQTGSNFPRVFIEKAQETAITTEYTGINKKNAEVFFINSRSTGASGNANTILQSSYRRAIVKSY
jgi:type IV pilus assembly protein PilX